MIATRVTWICGASTSGMRDTAFPSDLPLDAQGERQAREFAPHVARPDRVFIASNISTRRTANMLGLTGEIEPLLRDCDYGRWSGRSLDAVSAEEPEALSSWLEQPSEAPHGGESLADLFARVSSWLEGQEAAAGHAIAVAPAAVVRAAIVHVIQAPPRSFWRIDIEPLSQTELTRSAGQWRLRFPRQVVRQNRS